LFSVAKALGIDIDETSLPQASAQPEIPPPQPPTEAPMNLDQAGNPVVGQDDRQFNPERPRLPVSTVGNPGGANA